MNGNNCTRFKIIVRSKLNLRRSKLYANFAQGFDNILFVPIVHEHEWSYSALISWTNNIFEFMIDPNKSIDIIYLFKL